MLAALTLAHAVGMDIFALLCSQRLWVVNNAIMSLWLNLMGIPLKNAQPIHLLKPGIGPGVAGISLNVEGTFFIFDFCSGCCSWA